MKTKRRKKYNKKTLRKKNYKKKTFNKKNVRNSYRKNFRKTFNKKKFRNLKGRGHLSKKFSHFFSKKVPSRGVPSQGVKLFVDNTIFENNNKPPPVREQFPTRQTPPPGYIQSNKGLNYQTMKQIYRLTELSNKKKNLIEKFKKVNLEKLNYINIIKRNKSELDYLHSESEAGINEYAKIISYNQLIGKCIISENKISLNIKNIDKEISTIRKELKTEHLLEYIYI